MADYRKLEVWQMARRLVVEAYRFASELPESERFNLTSQIQRAAVSVPANIAEGAGRGSDAELIRFARIALGSLNELDTLALLAGDLGYLGEARHCEFEAGVRDLAVRLRNLIQRVEADAKVQRAVREERAPYGLDLEQAIVSHVEPLSAIVEPDGRAI